MYPHARLVWPVADLFGARTALAAKSLMLMAGEAKSEEDLKEIVEQYLQDVYPHVGIFGKGLKVRVSITRLVELYRTVAKGALMAENRTLNT